MMVEDMERGRLFQAVELLSKHAVNPAQLIPSSVGPRIILITNR